MRTTLVCCLLLNLAVILVSGALLQWFPSQQGFTVTTPHATHFIRGTSSSAQRCYASWTAPLGFIWLGCFCTRVDMCSGRVVANPDTPVLE